MFEESILCRNYTHFTNYTDGDVKSIHHTKTKNIESHVHALAAQARICLRTWWKRMWRLHVAVTRESVQRVVALGSVQKAMQNTSLVFFMRAYHAQLQNILDNMPRT